MPGVLDGKIALVTGGSSGIGRATAIDYARNGAKVVIADRQVKEGQDVVELIRQQGGSALFVGTDVSQEKQVQDLFATIKEKYQGLHIAFNNAGISGQIQQDVSQVTLDTWQAVLGTDLTGVFLCMRAEIPMMMAGGGGSIVNMSSIAGLVGTTLINPAYHASKFGVIGLTFAASLAHAAHNIRVNAVCPGFIETPMVETFFANIKGLREALTARIPMQKIGTPDDVAALVTWLSSDQARYVTGSAYTVDGGIVAQ